MLLTFTSKVSGFQTTRSGTPLLVNLKSLAKRSQIPQSKSVPIQPTSPYLKINKKLNIIKVDKKIIVLMKLKNWLFSASLNSLAYLKSIT